MRKNARVYGAWIAIALMTTACSAGTGASPAAPQSTAAAEDDALTTAACQNDPPSDDVAASLEDADYGELTCDDDVGAGDKSNKGGPSEREARARARAAAAATARRILGACGFHFANVGFKCGGIASCVYQVIASGQGTSAEAWQDCAGEIADAPECWDAWNEARECVARQLGGE